MKQEGDSVKFPEKGKTNLRTQDQINSKKKVSWRDRQTKLQIQHQPQIFILFANPMKKCLKTEGREFAYSYGN